MFVKLDLIKLIYEWYFIFFILIIVNKYFFGINWFIEVLNFILVIVVIMFFVVVFLG